MGVSIVIPVYNVEAFLRACLDSVLAQSYPDWEAILVDDASSDGSLSICEEYCRYDSRFHLVRHEKNRGLSAARNTAIRNSSCDLITFLDSDDKLHPLFLETMLAVLTREDADIVTCAITRNPFEKIDSINTSKAITIESRDFFEQVLYQKNPDINNSACGKIFKKKVVDSISFREGIYYEDLDFTFRLPGKVTNVAFIPEPLYYYRVNQGSITHTFSTARADVLDVTDRICKRMEQEYPELLPAANDRLLSASFNILGLMAASGTNYPEIENRCWSNIKKHRLQSLLNPKVRLKNKLGILLSYSGFKPMRHILARFYSSTK